MAESPNVKTMPDLFDQDADEEFMEALWTTWRQETIEHGPTTPTRWSGLSEEYRHAWIEAVSILRRQIAE